MKEPTYTERGPVIHERPREVDEKWTFGHSADTPMPCITT